MLSAGMQKFKESLSCCTYNGSQHTHILIKENDLSALLKTVKITAPTGDWFSFNPDEGRKCKHIHKSCNAVVMSPLLRISEQYDHHRACDSVVAINRNGGLTLIYFDLKSNNPAGYAGQFKSTRQFVRYALCLLEEFHQEKIIIQDERYVILYGGKPPLLLNKTTTVAKLDKIRKTKPDSAYKREVPDKAKLFLNEFLS
jgi:hypothetical protein